MKPVEISIVNEFSDTPGPRLIDEGDFSGELFRKEILEPKYLQAVEEDNTIIVNLDGGEGYGTSFLEEIFGGLARLYPIEDVSKRIKIISFEEDYLIDDIKNYIEKARDEKK